VNILTPVSGKALVYDWLLTRGVSGSNMAELIEVFWWVPNNKLTRLRVSSCFMRNSRQ